MVLHARQVTGADTEIRCNSQGRLETVISENITCAIQAANIGAGANIALRCSDTGRLLVHPPDQAAFDTIVILKDNEAIAPGYYQYASGDIRMTWEGESYYPLDGGSNMAEMQILHGNKNTLQM